MRAQEVLLQTLVATIPWRHRVRTRNVRPLGPSTKHPWFPCTWNQGRSLSPQGPVEHGNPRRAYQPIGRTVELDSGGGFAAQEGVQNIPLWGIMTRRRVVCLLSESPPKAENWRNRGGQSPARQV